jgi:hypothetical protein
MVIMPYKSSSVDLEEDFMFWLKKKEEDSQGRFISTLQII